MKFRYENFNWKYQSVGNYQLVFRWNVRWPSDLVQVVDLPIHRSYLEANTSEVARQSLQDLQFRVNRWPTLWQRTLSSYSYCQLYLRDRVEIRRGIPDDRLIDDAKLSLLIDVWTIQLEVQPDKPTIIGKNTVNKTINKRRTCFWMDTIVWCHSGSLVKLKYLVRLSFSALRPGNRTQRTRGSGRASPLGRRVWSLRARIIVT